jgi:ABC-type nitrate/sulfonate/bicarbonate transport system ATPase subunit
MEAERGRDIPKIQISDVSYRFDDGRSRVEVLDHVSLDIDDGEIVAILGPSGCGKTSLLNLVAGFVRPTEGSVRADGQVIRGPGPDRGVVFQDYALFRWLTVRGNVEFGLRMRRVPRDQRRAIADRFIALVGLTEFSNHYPYQLSGGMQQRVAIARVFANGSSVLLMDEPFGALDAQTRDVMQEELLRLWTAAKRTIIFVTHSAEEALFVASRVLIMSARPGRIKKVVNVDFGSNRLDYHVRTSAKFNELRAQILDMVREEARR